MKRIMIVIAAAALAGCSSDQALLKAQADAAVADGNARVAEANARAEEARAVIALAPKIDAGGASAYLIAKAVGGARASAPQPVSIQRPRDWLDYLQGFTSAVGALGNIAVPIVTVRENGRTQRELYSTNVQIEQARQTGETSRIQSVGQIASDVAANVHPSISIGGNGVVGSGSYSNATTTTTTTTTTHACNGGNGAAGGSGGTSAAGTGGEAGTGGAANGGSC